jgi:lipopolysaccharide export system protein LptA
MRLPASLLLLLLLPAQVWSAEDQQQPITVEADRLEMNNASGISHYQGNVIMTQGSMLLRANSVTLHSSGSELQRAEANGTPVYLERTDPQSGELLKANAGYIEYQIPQGLLEMKGEAHLWRGQDEFSGEHIVYELDKRIVRASGQNGGEETGRVKVILQPAKEPNGEQP